VANFGTTYSTPKTNVKLRWGTPNPDWDDEIKALYKSFKDNEFSEFFYQSDVAVLRILMGQLDAALENAEMTAAGWRTLWDQLDKFGATMKSRAGINYTVTTKTDEESYSPAVYVMLTEAVQPEKED
jgi:hypothetical protein